MPSSPPGPSATPLSTDRLLLEPLAVGHAEEMLPVLADPLLYAYTGGEPPSAAALRKRYERQVGGASPDGSEGWLNWIIRLRSTGAAAGFGQATLERDDQGMLTAEVAWLIGTAHQRQGFAREAAAAIVAWLRAEGVATVLAHIHPDHDASRSVARAIGLVDSGALDDGEQRWIG